MLPTRRTTLLSPSTGRGCWSGDSRSDPRAATPRPRSVATANLNLSEEATVVVLMVASHPDDDVNANYPDHVYARCIRPRATSLLDSAVAAPVAARVVVLTGW